MLRGQYDNYAGFTLLPLLLLMLLVSGCAHYSQGDEYADFPEAEQFPLLYQGKLMAATHWQLIAQNEAQLLSARFAPDSSFSVAPDSKEYPSPNRSRFGIAYRQMLTAGLLEGGMRVFDASGDFEVSYHLSIIAHQPRDQSTLPAGFFTGLQAGAYVLALIADKAAHPALALLPLGAAVDLYNVRNRDTETPNTEIILTTAVRREQQVVYSNSSIYYFNAVDQALYDDCSGEGCNDRTLPENSDDDTPRFRVADPVGGA